MQAITYHTYGSPDVLTLEEIPRPEVKTDEVLIQVLAAAVNPHDWHFLTGTPWLARLMAGPLKPKNVVLGVDVAGRVVEVGPNARQFQVGDALFGVCGHGAFAEYVAVSATTLVSKPETLSFEQAAAVPSAGLTALQALRDHGHLQPGQHVLINGAAGGVGTFAVQIAKSYRAEVTGVCSTTKLDLVRSLGADHVIDYTQEDFTSSEQQYDLIFDAARKRSFAECQPALHPRGIYVTTEMSPALLLQQRRAALTGGQQVAPMLTKPRQSDLAVLKGLIETGKIMPVVDRQYSLPEVPDALRYIGLGHATGKVVISL
jgi:NADPH:quinone reductase-like Zn-dependent oxidoreductase